MNKKLQLICELDSKFVTNIIYQEVSITK